MTWSWECGYRLIHTHSLLDWKSFTPSFIPCTDSIVRQRLQQAAGDPGSISLQQPKPDLRQRAPQLNPVSSPPNRPFPFCAGHDREASPGLSEEETCSLLRQKSVVPSSRRWLMPGFSTQVSAQLANSAAAVAVAGFSMWCVSSLTHSSSHSQTFSIRAHSSLPGFFKRLEISSGGLRCHPNGNRSASKKSPSKKPPNHKTPCLGDKTSSRVEKIDFVEPKEK